MFLIISLLNRPAAVRLTDSPIHRIRHGIRIHNHMTFGISGRTANGLNQWRFRTKESFFIRIENRNQSNFRNIQPFTQKINADKHIKDIQPQIPDNFRPLQCIDIRMQIFDPDPGFPHIVCQILCHTFCQSCNQYFMSLLCFFIHLTD